MFLIILINPNPNYFFIGTLSKVSGLFSGELPRSYICKAGSEETCSPTQSDENFWIEYLSMVRRREMEFLLWIFRSEKIRAVIALYWKMQDLLFAGHTNYIFIWVYRFIWWTIRMRSAYWIGMRFLVLS